MKRVGIFIFAILAATTVVAQTSLSLWPYYVEVTPERNANGMYETTVPLLVIDRARPDLADLRLYDSSNREVPYAIRVLREVDEEKEMTARIFNNVTAGSESEVSVDLGEIMVSTTKLRSPVTELTSAARSWLKAATRAAIGARLTTTG